MVENLQPLLEYTTSSAEATTNLQKKIEDDLWKRLMKLRAARDLRTRSNAAVAARCREVCEAMEHFRATNREGGNESPPPLRPAGVQKPQPATEMVRALEEQVTGQNRGSRVFGVPLNCAYSDLASLWTAVQNTEIASLGGDDAEYAVAAKVFAYPHKIFSVWVFLMCITK